MAGTFKTVLGTGSPGCNSEFSRYVSYALSATEGAVRDNAELIAHVTTEELFTVIRVSKTGKASYLDEIPNEVLKYGIDFLIFFITLLWYKPSDPILSKGMERGYDHSHS